MSRVKGKSNPHDFALAAQACIPIISTILVDIKNQSYPGKCFLNIDVPNDVANHKVYCNKFCNLCLACDLSCNLL
jgi:5'-nucleotidase